MFNSLNEMSAQEAIDMYNTIIAANPPPPTPPQIKVTRVIFNGSKHAGSYWTDPIKTSTGDTIESNEGLNPDQQLAKDAVRAYFLSHL